MAMVWAGSSPLSSANAINTNLSHSFEVALKSSVLSKFGLFFTIFSKSAARKALKSL
ncbi:hypothetical protein [Campylobacter gastrosuis]|uniref:Uncharacterized protein n=1 Tax=Campylobacter gastrosuis TaxID=2974576 RepID=A0ABT7HS45_9BACT|nr:hypothetical protein [Campylobacter gastrosuis]MDL0089741.1 hypothetical protein [Campylobacter gastrosuis]